MAEGQGFSNRSLTEQQDREERLAAVLEHIYDCLERGDQLDVDELCAAHEDLAEEIRECVASLSFLRTVELISRRDGEPVRELKPGERFGQYQILREIGRGGMGIVYEARHTVLDRPVALKVLVSSAAFGAEARRKFYREARTAANLHHTNIVPIFDVGEVDGICYYAMQLIHGCPLNHLIAVLKHEKPIWTSSTIPLNEGLEENRRGGADGRVAPVCNDRGAGEGVSEAGEDAARLQCLKAHPDLVGGLSCPGYYRYVAGLIAQVARALAYAHKRGVVHRDIKPSNLLLDSDGVLWITDFGLAVHMLPDGLEGQSSASFELVGTPHYMSPEQVMPGERRPDHRMDIYSLGATLYELVTLRPMVEGKNTLAILTAIVSEVPKPPRTVNPRVPRDLDAIIRKATAKDPDDRYQTADELADDLERFVRYEPTRARPLGIVGRFARWCQRQPMLAATLAATLLVTGGTLGVAYHNVKQERDQALTARRVAEAALRDAQEARRRAQQKLWESLFQQARATLATRNAGRRSAALSLLQQAAAMNFSAELRDVAVAALAMPDLRLAGTVTLDAGITYIGFASAGSECLIGTRYVDLSEREDDVFLGKIYVRLPETGQLTEAFPRPVEGFVGQVVRRQDGTLVALVWRRRDEDNRRGPSREFAASVWTSVGDIFPVAREGEVADWARIVNGGSRVIAWYRRAGDIVSYQLTGDGLRELVTMHVGEIETVTLGPDRRNELTVLSADGTVDIWNLTTGEEVAQLWSRPIATPGRRLLQWDARGRLLAVGSAYGTVAVWSRDRDEPLYILSGHRGPITHVAFSPQGDLVATASVADLSLRVWQANSGEELATLRALGSPPTAVTFSSEGRWLIAGSRDGRLAQWEVLNASVARELTVISGPFRDATYAGAEDRIVVATQQGRLVVVDAKVQQILGEYDLPEPRGFRSRVACLECLPDGQVCWQTYDGALWLGDDNGTAERLLPRAGRLPFAGRTLLIRAGGQEIVRLTPRTLELWVRSEDNTYHRTAEIRPDRGLFLDIAPYQDGVVGLANQNKKSTLYFYQIVDGRVEVERVVSTSIDGSRLVALDGDRLVLGSWTGELYLVDRLTGRTTQLARRAAPVTMIEVAPQGARLAVGYEDGAVELWKTEPAVELAYRLPEGAVGPVSSVRFSSDGDHLLVSGDYLVEWDLRELERELQRLTLLPPAR